MYSPIGFGMPGIWIGVVLWLIVGYPLLGFAMGASCSREPCNRGSRAIEITTSELMLGGRVRAIF